MLKTERNTGAMGRRVLACARAAGLVKRGRGVAVFEHGQWWVEDRLTGAQWSACDAVGSFAVDGFVFEQVTQGEEC